MALRLCLWKLLALLTSVRGRRSWRSKSGKLGIGILMSLVGVAFACVVLVQPSVAYFAAVNNMSIMAAVAVALIFFAIAPDKVDFKISANLGNPAKHERD